MNRALVHRGPDDEGTYVDPDAGLALGARRLRVIDVDGGHQPLANEDGTVWAVLNGEIYNYGELRAGLAGRGHRLATATDTEVLVHLYEEHGADLVHVLDGMYAFAVWDRPRRRLLLVRDRFGEKPLFYAARGRELTFASELGALTRGLGAVAPPLDPRAVGAFLTLGYIPGRVVRAAGRPPAEPGPQPPLERIARRAAGRALLVAGRPPARPRALPLEAAVASVSGAFADSVRRRLVADVPVGVLLSGGLDSTLVAAYAARASSRPVRTFTVGYDVGEVSETGRARHVAEVLGTEHREVVLTSSRVGETLPALMGALDQPLADPAVVALHAVCALAREDVTVAVGGEGADELFGGYPRYRWLERSVALGHVVPAPVLRTGSRVLSQMPLTGRQRRLLDVVRPADPVDRHLSWVTGGRWPAARDVWGPALLDAAGFDAAADARGIIGRSQATSTAGRFMALDRDRWLADDVLVKADRASMLVSLELRTPFLDSGGGRAGGGDRAGRAHRGRGQAHPARDALGGRARAPGRPGEDRVPRAGRRVAAGSAARRPAHPCPRRTGVRRGLARPAGGERDRRRSPRRRRRPFVDPLAGPEPGALARGTVMA